MQNLLTITMTFCFPPSTVPENDEADVDKNGSFLSIEFEKSPTRMSTEEFIDLMDNDKE